MGRSRFLIIAIALQKCENTRDFPNLDLLRQSALRLFSIVNGQQIFRIKLWYIPIFCGIVIATFYVVRLQNLFDSFSRLIVNRKPHDMEIISKSLALIEEAGGKDKIEKNIAALAEGGHRNTAFLLFRLGRHYPDLIVQPKNSISQDVIRAAINKWGAETFGGLLYQNGFTTKIKSHNYHLIARRKSVREGSYELFLITNIDRSISEEYQASTIALTILLIAMSAAIFPALLSVTVSVKRNTEFLRDNEVSPSFYWTEEVYYLFTSIKQYKIESELAKTQINQSTSGQVVVKALGQEEGIMYNPNKALSEITGYTYTELNGKPLNLIVQKQFHHFHKGIGAFDEKLGRRVGMNAYASGCPFHGHQKSKIVGRDRTVDLLHKDGSVRKIILGVDYIGKDDDGKDTWVGVITDVTELSDAVAKAEAFAKDVQNITHIFAHDLKAGEIASAKAGEYVTETAKDLIVYLRDAGHLDKEIERSLNFIAKYSSRITASCQNNFALIDQRNKLHDLADRITPEPHLIKEIFDGIDVSFNRSDGKLVFVDECPDGTKAHIDIALFLSAMKNLVKNGFAYNTSIDKTIEIKAAIENDQILFSVKDNGIGFPPDYIKTWGQIQGQAARLDPSREGSGTGLFSVRRIIEAHKGASVDLISEQGVGSTFSIKVGIGH